VVQYCEHLYITIIVLFVTGGSLSKLAAASCILKPQSYAVIILLLSEHNNSENNFQRTKRTKRN